MRLAEFAWLLWAKTGAIASRPTASVPTKLLQSCFIRSPSVRSPPSQINTRRRQSDTGSVAYEAPLSANVQGSAAGRIETRQKVQFCRHGLESIANDREIFIRR